MIRFKTLLCFNTIPKYRLYDVERRFGVSLVVSTEGDRVNIHLFTDTRFCSDSGVEFTGACPFDSPTIDGEGVEGIRSIRFLDSFEDTVPYVICIYSILDPALEVYLIIILEESSSQSPTGRSVWSTVRTGSFM